jgi:hypothetical protein
VAQFSALPGRINFLWQAYTIHIWSHVIILIIMSV